MECKHNDLVCINQYEFIRKYYCKKCSNVIMCECDRFIGETFLSHQLKYGVDLKTQKRLEVTLGFQQCICDECRGNPIIATPVAEIYGRTSKIYRYYWREIYFETCKRYFLATGDNSLPSKHPEVHNQIEHEVVEWLKEIHKTKPKYQYTDLSDNEVITRFSISVIRQKAIHVHDDGKKVKILDKGIKKTVEQYAIDYFLDQGNKVIVCESRPFHVLFGDLMWLLIQDFHDPLNRVAGFGKRPVNNDFSNNDKSIVWLTLPEDFGSEGYYKRRKTAIEEHFDSLIDLNWLFDYWLEPSKDLREYLWAHDPKDIETAKKLINVFTLDEVKLILNYLINDYWSNYCGWPDLLVINENEKLFVEVKSANDKLSNDQKHWIENNYDKLHFQFKIFKVLKE